MGSKEFRTQLLIQKLTKIFQNHYSENCKNLLDIPLKKVLVIAPHADDEVIGCGAAIDYFIKNNIEVYVLIVTQEADKSIAKKYNYTPQQRVQESIEAQKILGYENLIYFDYPELGFKENQQVKTSFYNQLDALLCEIEPQCIFLPNTKEMHPDHRAIGEISQNLIADAKVNNKYNFLEYLFIYEVWGPIYMNAYLEVSEETKQKKEQSILCYKSQLSSIDYLQIMNFIGTFRATVLNKIKNKKLKLVEGYTLFLEHQLSTIKNNV